MAMVGRIRRLMTTSSSPNEDGMISTGKVDANHSALRPRRRTAVRRDRGRDRGWVVDQAGLDDHVLGVSLEVAGHHPRGLEGDDPIGGVVAVAARLVVDRDDS